MNVGAVAPISAMLGLKESKVVLDRDSCMAQNRADFDEIYDSIPFANESRAGEASAERDKALSR